MTSRFWLFGIITGAAVATAVTVFVTAWEWLENPGGIFHDANGTNWNFIYETAVSWFGPVFGSVSVGAALAHLLWTRLRTYRENRQDRFNNVD